ncbi:MAG: cyclic nucleotide-binding domain-containing protein [Myxococcales bacterium]|nr:cyclic nucleotide-binding domain-containing protein [Myxococcales bacterium]MBL0193813.1 cyclic nucleotide-binding domain-containing protein [Myxococcales bacterium]HQY61676.1 cyclic nucleotide-binding domain-containing protein [Polyangiaceae bacterium]
MPPRKDDRFAPTVIHGRPGEPLTERFGSPHASPRLPDDAREPGEGLRLPSLLRLGEERALAEGGMGVITVAKDPLLGREVAVKTLHRHLSAEPPVRRLFLREAHVMGLLEHPHIVPVYDVGEREDGRLALVMKLIEGRTLASMIRALPKGPIDTGTLYVLLEVITKVCDALSYAHDRGVLHCDVKPSNVMVGDYGQVYLTDWGIARFEASGRPSVPSGDRPDSPPSNEPTDDPAPNVVIGTLAYLSPEQARGERSTLDERADVFLVGAVLYELLARRPPYPTREPAEAVAQASACAFPPPSAVAGAASVPAELERIVLRAMAKERGERYASVRGLRDDLSRFLRGGAEFPRQVFRAGDVIVREGDAGDAAYIVAEGLCDVRKRVAGGTAVVKTLGPGDVFGEMAILTAGPRTASVVAVEDTTVLVLTSEALEDELAALKPWMASLLRTLAKRFREADQRRVTALSAPSPVRLANYIFMKLSTWGTPAFGGGRQVAWSALAKEIEEQLGVPALSAWQLVSLFGLFDLDIYADTVVMRDEAKARATLAAELGHRV